MHLINGWKPKPLPWINVEPRMQWLEARRKHVEPSCEPSWCRNTCFWTILRKPILLDWTPFHSIHLDFDSLDIAVSRSCLYWIWLHSFLCAALFCSVLFCSVFPQLYSALFCLGSTPFYAFLWCPFPLYSVVFCSFPFSSCSLFNSLFFSFSLVSIPFVSFPFLSIPFHSLPFLSIPFPFPFFPFLSSPCCPFLFFLPCCFSPLCCFCCFLFYCIQLYSTVFYCILFYVFYFMCSL